MAQEISHFSEMIYLGPPVTLKIRSRSSKPNQHLSVSQRYIQADLVESRQLVHEMSWVQEFVT